MQQIILICTSKQNVLLTVLGSLSTEVHNTSDRKSSGLNCHSYV